MHINESLYDLIFFKRVNTVSVTDSPQSLSLNPVTLQPAETVLSEFKWSN